MSGELHVTVGCMFAGKSTLAMTEVYRKCSIDRAVLVVKHHADVARNGSAALQTHDGFTCPGVAVGQLVPMLTDPRYQMAQDVVVEEAQFFPDLLEFCALAVERDGKIVHVYGLDADCLRRPFGQVAELLPRADTFRKVNALCQLCRNGRPAIHTLHRSALTVANDISVGGGETYMALCRQHYVEQMTRVQNVDTAMLINWSATRA